MYHQRLAINRILFIIGAKSSVADLSVQIYINSYIYLEKQEFKKVQVQLYKF